MESTQSTPVDGRSIHYVRAGQGPTVVLLHGSGSSLEGFKRVAELLSPSHDVIRPDLPGFGRTGPRPDRDYRVRTYAGTIARFMTALGVPHWAATSRGTSPWTPPSGWTRWC
jgi:pimeloyl-ACP methyl ester carboxylesterase